MITFFGVASPDDRVPTPNGFTAGGLPIYERPIGFNFAVVVEGRPGGSRQKIGLSTFNSDPMDPLARPDLQLLVSQPLGDGSAAVCDNMPPDAGGIPAVNPTDYAFTQPISDAINDLGCRFVDGLGRPLGRSTSQDACTLALDGSGEFRFVSPGSTTQFCGAIAPPFAFPLGDTLVTVRLRDQGKNLSLPAQIVIRVLGQATP
jgi:hypothetical protein